MSPADDDFRRGLAHLSARRFLRARPLLARAAAAGGERAAWAAQELVQTFLRRNEAGAAEPFLRERLPPSPLLEHALGYLARRTGRVAEGRVHLEAAAAAGFTPSFPELGYVLCRAGERAAGEPLIRAAERYFVRQGDAWGRSVCTAYRATDALLSFRLGEARRGFTRAIEEKQACGDRFGLGSAWANLGTTFWHLGEYASAIAANTRAIELFVAGGDQKFAGIVWNDLGLCRLELADYARAGDAFRSSVRLLWRSNDRISAAAARENLAYAARHRGDLVGAIRNYRRALAELGSDSPKDVRGVILADLADALTAHGRPREAREAIASLGEPDRRQSGALSRILLARESARASLALGEVGEGMASAREALAIARTLPSAQRGRVSHWVPAEMLLGRALIAQGQERAGIETLRRAARRIEVLLARQPEATVRMGLLETSRAVHDALLAATFTRGGPAAARLAWAVFAPLKARELQAAMERAPRPRRDRDIATAVEAEIRQLASQPELDRRRSRRLRELRRAYGDMEGAVGRSSRRGAGASREKLARVQRGLAPGEGLVEYHVASETTYAVAATRDRIDAVDLRLSEAQLRRSIDRVLAPIHAAGANPGSAAMHLDTFDVTACRRLYRRLLAPVLALLPSGTRSLRVVPDGTIHLLPFDLLLRFGHPPTAPDGGITVTYAPSSLVGDRVRRGERPRGQLVLAWTPLATTVIQGPAGPIALEPLPGVAREAHAVAHAWGGGLVLEGRRATAAAFVAAAPRASVIHIAAHVVADPTSPASTGIVTAPEDRSHQVGFVTGAQVAALRLRAEVVSLAACDSARGRILREGALSLARSFLQAGARSVVATLWPVADDAARILMAEFHRRLKAGEKPSAALAAAKQELRRRKRWSHPFYWSAFALIELVASRPETEG